MSFLVNLLQSFGRDVGVDLRRRQIGVAEEFLDAAEVGAGIEHVRGEAVSQLVRRQRRVEADGEQILLQHALHAARRHPAAETIHEQRAARAALPECEILLQRLDRRPAERREAFLLAFPAPGCILTPQVTPLL